MAAAADVLHLITEQPINRRCVRRMAIDAAGFVGEGPMQPVFTERFVDHLVMTALAEFETRLDGGKRCRRVGFFVTLLAHPAGQRLVDVVIQHGGHVRSMRVVAGRTVGGFDRVTDMLTLEGFLAGIMAVEAQLRRLATQQGRVFG